MLAKLGLTRKEGLLLPRNIRENLGILEAYRLSRILRGKEYGEAGGETQEIEEKYAILALTSL